MEGTEYDLWLLPFCIQGQGAETHRSAPLESQWSEEDKSAIWTRVIIMDNVNI